MRAMPVINPSTMNTPFFEGNQAFPQPKALRMAAVVAPPVIRPKRCSAARKLNCERPACTEKPAERTCDVLHHRGAAQVGSPGPWGSRCLSRDNTISLSARCRGSHSDEVSRCHIRPTHLVEPQRRPLCRRSCFDTAPQVSRQMAHADQGRSGMD